MQQFFLKYFGEVAIAPPPAVLATDLRSCLHIVLSLNATTYHRVQRCLRQSVSSSHCHCHCSDCTHNTRIRRRKQSMRREARSKPIEATSPTARANWTRSLLMALLTECNNEYIYNTVLCHFPLLHSVYEIPL